MPQPIELHYWPTPNGQKPAIFLEEVGLPYKVVPVDIMAGDQFKEDFLKISPNNKMPAIVDPEGPDGEPISLFESGAILIYLAEKTGRFYPQSPRERYEVLQWLMFQMGGVGPMLGQAHHFRLYAPEKIPYAVDRYTKEAARLYGVMDKRLADHDYLAADEYTIADIAVWPWLNPEGQGQDMNDYPNLSRWHEEIGARPAVAKAVDLGKDLRRPPEEWDDEDRANLFGTRNAGS